MPDLSDYLPDLKDLRDAVTDIEAELLTLYVEIKALTASVLKLPKHLVHGARRGYEMEKVTLPDNLVDKTITALKKNPGNYFAGLIEGYGVGAGDFIDFAGAVVLLLIGVLTNSTARQHFLEELWKFYGLLKHPKQVEEFAEAAAMLAAKNLKTALDEDDPDEFARWIGYAVGLIGFEIVFGALTKGASALIGRAGALLRNSQVFRKMLARAKKINGLRGRMAATGRRSGDKAKAAALKRRASKQREDAKSSFDDDKKIKEQQQRTAILKKRLGPNYNILHKLYERFPKLSLDAVTIDELTKALQKLKKGASRKNPPKKQRQTRQRQGDVGELIVLEPLQKNSRVTKIQAVKPTNTTGKKRPDWLVTYTDGGIEKKIYIENRARTTARRDQLDILDRKRPAGESKEAIEKRKQLDEWRGVRDRVFVSKEVTSEIIKKITHGQINPKRKGVILHRITPKTPKDDFGLTGKQVEAIEAAAKKNGGVLEVLVAYNNKFYRVGKGTTPLFPVQAHIPSLD